MKSTLGSVMWPTWLWAQKASGEDRDAEIDRYGRTISGPSLKILTFSYSSDNTIRDNLRARDIIESDWYRKHFPDTILKSDQNAKVRFDTTLAGWRIASSVGGRGTGEHPDIIILDDTIKAEDALSQTELSNNISWYKSTISTRVNRNPIIVLFMQRLAIGDLSDYLIDHGFQHVVFPMRYETHRRELEPGKPDPNDKRNIPHPRDHRIEPGELLWPELFPEDKVSEMEELLDFFASGQLQQYPIAIGGKLLSALSKCEYIDADEVPSNAILCRGWDIAETKPLTPKQILTANYTSGTLVGYAEGIIYIIDNVECRDDPDEVDKLMLSTAMRDGKRVSIREGSGSGKNATKAHSKMLAGWDYDTVPESESKVLRIIPFRSQLNQGNVRIVRGAWNNKWLSNMLAFPTPGVPDDDVDSTGNAVNSLIGVRVFKPRALGSGGASRK